MEIRKDVVAIALAATVGVIVLFALRKQQTKAPSSTEPRRSSTSPDEYEKTDAIPKQPSLRNAEADDSPSKVPTAGDATRNSRDNDETEKRADLAQAESSLGAKAFKAGSYRLAIEHFDRAIDLCPSEDLGSKKVMLNNRAAAREKLGEWAEVESDSTGALAIDPTYRRALTRRAKAREKLGRLAEALSDLALWKTIELGSSSDEERMQVAQTMDNLAQNLAKAEADKIWKVRKQERRGVLDIPRVGTCRQFYYAFSLDARGMRAPPSAMAVKDALERLDKSAPDYGEQLFKLAMMYKTRMELKEAFDLWQQVVATPSASVKHQARALAEIASLHHLSGDINSAFEKLEASQKLHETAQAYIKLAALAVEDGDFVLGRKQMEKALKCIPSSPEAKNDRADYNFHLSAITCLEASDLNVARELLESAIADVPDYGLAYMQLGVVLFRMNLVEESLEALEQACLMVPELAEVHNFHGEVLMSLNKRDEAITKFLEASNADEHCALPLLNRGVMFMSAEPGAPPTEEEMKHALEMFNKAVDVDPTNEIAYIHRASYYCTIGDLKTALENYDRAIELTKSVPYLIEYLGFRYMCAADLSVQEALHLNQA